MALSGDRIKKLVRALSVPDISMREEESLIDSYVRGREIRSLKRSTELQNLIFLDTNELFAKIILEDNFLMPSQNAGARKHR